MNHEMFWRYAYTKISNSSDIFKHVKEWDKNYLNGETGYWQVFYKLAVTKVETRVDLFLGRYIAEENKALFDELYKRKEEIERVFGAPLIWERINSKKLCRICSRYYGFHPHDESEWPNVTDYFITQINNLSIALRKPLEEAFDALLWIPKSKSTY